MTHSSRRSPGPLRSLLSFLILALSVSSAAWSAAPVPNDDQVLATDRDLVVVGGEEVYSILIDVLANDEDADGDRLDVVVQGDFGLPPVIWNPNPTGTVQYLGGGVFELTVGKEALGDAREVTFQYELEGAASYGTVTVTVAGDGPAPEVIARDDVFDDPWSCSVEVPALANDTGLDTIVHVSSPSNGTVEPHPADPTILVYRGGFNGATFTYTASSSITGQTDSATVEVQAGYRLGKGGSIRGGSDIAMADCFDRPDGTPLDGEQVSAYHGTPGLDGLYWVAPDIGHLGESATVDTAISGGGPVRTRRAYLPLHTGELDGSAYDLRTTFRADPNAAEWMALAFTHAGGVIPQNGDLWVRLDVETGELFLRACCDGSGSTAVLGNASPATHGYTFLPGGVNHVRLRWDTAPAVPRVDLWLNGTRVFSRVPLTGLTTAATQVGYFINYGTHASSPGEVWFDDFELRVNDVQEATLLPKSGHPTAGLDVENGSTIQLDPLHVGCTSQHSGCSPARETSLWLNNEGEAPLELSLIRFDGPTAWTLVAPATTELTVPAGGTTEIRVRVDALEVGATASRLEMTTNDPDTPKLRVGFETEVFEPPTADFVYYCDELECSFDARASSGLNLTSNSYSWTLDGSLLGGGETREISFPDTGAYTVRLTVLDESGASHHTERSIALSPRAAFTYTCVDADRTCDFDAAASSAGIASYLYTFGDGSQQAGLDDPGDVVYRHTYETSGRYVVTLTVQDDEGQEDSVSHEIELKPTADFTFDCSDEITSCDLDASASSPGMILYEWSFGDGGWDTGSQVSHPYPTSGVYIVTLTVVDSAGQVDAVSKTVTVPPRAEITLACETESLTCDFDGSGSTPGVTYTWSFGDGSPNATGATPSHTYEETGIFEVLLTVTDGSGQTASDSRPVALAPSAAFTVSCDGPLCDFDASASSPGAASFAWSFGHDGATGTGAAPSHAFPTGGAYEVSLAVTDGSGQSATTTQTVTVSDDETLLLILLGRR